MAAAASKKSAKGKGGRSRAKTKPAAERSRLRRGLLAVVGLLAVTASALALLYVFSPIERRATLEAFAFRQLHALRTAGYLPAPATAWIARVEDQIPGSSGFGVDAGELDFSEPHVLAGLPLSRREHSLLRNTSYLNRFDEAARRPACVLLQLTSDASGYAPDAPAPRYDDTRVRTHPPQALQLGKWRDVSLAPATALARQHGEAGLREANLSSALVPMPGDFAARLWEPLVHELSLRYPRRFDEVWLAFGPIYRETHAKTAAGVPLPDAYFAIALDLTEAGALRAISFILPADATGTDWTQYLSPMATIETLTGLQFLPELRPHTRQSLVQWQPTRLW